MASKAICMLPSVPFLKPMGMDRPSPVGGGGSPPAGRAPPPKAVPIPRKYQDVNTSGLAYTITPGTKELEIKLE